MARIPIKPGKLRSTLIAIIFATLPCYLLGFIVLWVGNSIEKQRSLTPTVTMAATVDPWGGPPTATLPGIPTYPPTPSLTPTITNTPAPTATFVIPTDTPTPTSTSTLTPTITQTEAATFTATFTATVTETEAVVVPTEAP
mgnify:CR=1 FL=1